MKENSMLIKLLIAIMIAVPGCMSQAPHLHPHNIPPAPMLMHPGPGVGGPGPGVMIQGEGAMGGLGDGASGLICGAGDATSQVAFIGPDGMSVQWDVVELGAFDSEPLVVPGRQNFPQGGIYRLKLAEIPGREGLELYPTLEIGPATPRTDAFLAHAPIPVEFTAEDFDQVTSGNFVTKVIYLPDPEFQELALAGVETLVSTRLDPGVDPIVEADRRGSILAIVRLGNKDLEIPTEMPTGSGHVVPASHSDPTGHHDVSTRQRQQTDIQASAIHAGAPGMPMGAPTAAFAPPAVPPDYVAGVSGPQWGMPMSGTPIGLPGPPHIPLGVPAGLQKHVIKNHTKHHIPKPTRKFKIDVKQRPGFSYPKPSSHVSIHENVKAPWKGFFIPWSNHKEIVK